MPSQLAVQLYTLRNFTKTPADIAATLKKVKQMGYNAVQASALGPIDPKELANLLKNEGLTCCATHTPLDRLRDDSQEVIDEHALWNCTYTALGSFNPKNPQPSDWTNFVRDYNAIIAKYKSSPLKVGYHNHSHELAKFDGKTALRMLLDGLSSDAWFELDTYWLVHGGADPVQWITDVKNRIPCVHLKDFSVLPDRTNRMAEVGEGNLNWKAILAACKSANVQWYIVEQDETYGRDPFESLAISLRNLKAMGLS